MKILNLLFIFTLISCKNVPQGPASDSQTKSSGKSTEAECAALENETSCNNWGCYWEGRCGSTLTGTQLNTEAYQRNQCPKFATKSVCNSRLCLWHAGISGCHLRPTSLPISAMKCEELTLSECDLNRCSKETISVQDCIVNPDFDGCAQYSGQNSDDEKNCVSPCKKVEIDGEFVGCILKTHAACGATTSIKTCSENPRCKVGELTIPGCVTKSPAGDH